MSPQVEVVPATPADRVVVGRLLELYVYDFTEFTAEDVDEQGLFGYRHLDAYWSEPDRHPFLIRADERLAGLALVHSGNPHDMAEFFVMRRHRGRGVGLTAARSLFAEFPGEWQVRQMSSNPAATAFWRNAIPMPFRDDVNDEGPVQRFHIAKEP